MIDIQPQYLTLATLLDRRLFYIPDYQRAYSWTSHERKDLFEDIKKVDAEGTQGSHFMATIVCLRRKKVVLGTDEFHQLDIVDGQQRLTTLIILLNAIRLALNSQKSKEKKVARELGELLVKVDGDNLLLLQTNHDTSYHFAYYLREGQAKRPDSGKTVADRELLTAIEDCQKFVRDWVASDRKLVDLVAHIKNRLSFILHEISDEKLVYTVFEVLNSRGMAVSWLDRLKSMLMGKAFELENADREQLIDELHTIWCHIYAQIGLQQGLSTEALRFAATLHQSSSPNRPLNAKDAVDTLQSVACDAASIRKVAHWLLRVTKACDEVISNRRLSAVTRIAQARLLAVAIHLRENTNSDERSNLLARWEKVSFRIYGMLKNDARTRVGSYVRLAWKIVHENLSVEDISSEIKVIGEEFSIDRAVDTLRNGNCYDGWQDELRYFMFRYEEYLAEKRGINFKNEQWERIWAVSPSKSIEHIFPQSTAPDDIKHSLGNLMLLPPNLNSQLRDKSPKEKCNKYLETGLLIAMEVASIRRWSKKAVRDRKETILKWASDEWSD